MIELKRFTDLKNTRENKGEILQSIIYVLKLMYGYDYSSDRLKHIGDIIGWTHKIAEKVDSDRSAKGVYYMIRYFDKEFPFSKNKTKIQRILKNYDPNRVVTKAEYIYAELLVFSCIDKLDSTEAADYLLSVFPKSGFDDWESVKDAEIL